MTNTIHVDVVSAEEQIYSGEAEFVVLPGVVGELGIYPRHTPLLTQIKPGSVRIKTPGSAQEELVFVQGGYLEVQPRLAPWPKTGEPAVAGVSSFGFGGTNCHVVVQERASAELPTLGRRLERACQSPASNRFRLSAGLYSKYRQWLRRYWPRRPAD